MSRNGPWRRVRRPATPLFRVHAPEMRVGGSQSGLAQWRGHRTYRWCRRKGWQRSTQLCGDADGDVV